MGAIRLATSNSTDEEYGGTFATEATDVAYNNTSSRLTADDVQEAIDELANYHKLISAGNIAINSSVTIPSTVKEIYIRIDINSYVKSDIYRISSQHVTVAWGYLSWLAQFELSNNNNVIKFESETTLIGNKATAWTTNIEVFYI